MKKEEILQEIERLQEVLAFVSLYEGNQANFEDAYRLLIAERELYPDHTTIYGNNLRQSDEKEARHYKAVRDEGGKSAIISYDSFISNFFMDVSNEIGRLNLEVR